MIEAIAITSIAIAAGLILGFVLIGIINFLTPETSMQKWIEISKLKSINEKPSPSKKTSQTPKPKGSKSKN